jgi:hypothetical protein
MLRRYVFYYLIYYFYLFIYLFIINFQNISICYLFYFHTLGWFWKALARWDAHRCGIQRAGDSLSRPQRHAPTLRFLSFNLLFYLFIFLLLIFKLLLSVTYFTYPRLILKSSCALGRTRGVQRAGDPLSRPQRHAPALRFLLFNLFLFIYLFIINFRIIFICYSFYFHTIGRFWKALAHWDAHRRGVQRAGDPLSHPQRHAAFLIIYFIILFIYLSFYC